MITIYLSSDFVFDHRKEITVWLDAIIGDGKWRRRFQAKMNDYTFQTFDSFHFYNEANATMFILRWA